MSRSIPPPLALEERRAALAKSAVVGRQRAELLEQLRMGTTTLAELLDRVRQDDDVVGRMRLATVLESLPDMTRRRARRICDLTGISDTKRLQGLGSEQRAVLLRVVSAEGENR
ncbi:MAG: integration host factor [Actinomycetota bacterium]|nr:integration host factor [Actinomycetota bacterium]